MTRNNQYLNRVYLARKQAEFWDSVAKYANTQKERAQGLSVVDKSLSCMDIQLKTIAQIKQLQTILASRQETLSP